MINKFRYRENIQSAYINLQGSYKRLSVQAGLRVEHTEGNAQQYDMPLKPDTLFRLQYTNLFPTAYLMYKADSNGNNIVSFSVGKRIHYHLEFDTQRFDITFSYRFGKAVNTKERRTGLDAELRRAN